jgi:glyceraldehyde-3-phosphate dehydrogenase (NAD(P))
MTLIGIADVTTDWRLRTAAQKGFKLFSSVESSTSAMRKAGSSIEGTLDGLLGRGRRCCRLHAEPSVVLVDPDQGG